MKLLAHLVEYFYNNILLKTAHWENQEWNGLHRNIFINLEFPECHCRYPIENGYLFDVYFVRNCFVKGRMSFGRDVQLQSEAERERERDLVTFFLIDRFMSMGWLFCLPHWSRNRGSDRDREREGSRSTQQGTASPDALISLNPSVYINSLSQSD